MTATAGAWAKEKQVRMSCHVSLFPLSAVMQGPLALISSERVFYVPARPQRLPRAPNLTSPPPPAPVPGVVRLACADHFAHRCLAVGARCGRPVLAVPLGAGWHHRAVCGGCVQGAVCVWCLPASQGVPDMCRVAAVPSCALVLPCPPHIPTRSIGFSLLIADPSFVRTPLWLPTELCVGSVWLHARRA
jgi:hypothetical protein